MSRSAGVTSDLGVRAAHLHIVDPSLVNRVAVAPYDAMPLDAPPAPPDPLSYLHVLRGPDGGEASQHNRLALRRMLRDGVFRPGPSPGFAWYRLATRDHVQTGLVAEVAVAEYDRGRIVRHEHTRAEREEQLAAYQQAVAADGGPVALAFRDDRGLIDLERAGTAGPPHLRFTADNGVEHTVWTVSDPDQITGISEAVQAVDRLYITDGHHRFAAASRVAAARRAAGADPADPDQWLLAALFPSDELRILPFHRAVQRPRGPATSEVLAEIAAHVQVTSHHAPAAPSQPGEFVMWLDERWHDLRVTASESRHTLESLEVTKLQRHVLEPVFRVHEPRIDPRLSYVSGGPEAVAAHCRRRGAIGFMVRPTSMAQLMAVADADLVMPPKSTLFWPKTHAGIVLRLTA